MSVQVGVDILKCSGVLGVGIGFTVIPPCNGRPSRSPTPPHMNRAGRGRSPEKVLG